MKDFLYLILFALSIYYLYSGVYHCTNVLYVKGICKSKNASTFRSIVQGSIYLLLVMMKLEITKTEETITFSKTYTKQEAFTKLAEMYNPWTYALQEWAALIEFLWLESLTYPLDNQKL